MEDLESGNGLVVNGRRIRHCVLHDGDRIQFGGAAKIRMDEDAPLVTDVVYTFRVNKKRRADETPTSPAKLPRIERDDEVAEKLKALRAELKAQHEEELKKLQEQRQIELAEAERKLEMARLVRCYVLPSCP